MTDTNPDTPVSDAELIALIAKLEPLREGLDVPYERVWAITHIIEDCRDELYKRQYYAQVR